MYQTALERFEFARKATLELVVDLAPSQADVAPAPGKWSAGEVLDHLLLAEGIYRGIIADLIRLAVAGERPEIRKDFSNLDVSLRFIPRFMHPFLGFPLMMTSMFVPGVVRDLMTRYPIFPANNPDVAEPRKGRPLETLRNELQTSLAQTKALLNSHPELDYKRMIFRHPLLGTNNVPQLLRLTALHEERHQDQLHRAIG